MYSINNNVVTNRNMKQIIINADDCGKSAQVDKCIEEGIELGKISSTTIMANMDDFDGAVRLYKRYSNQVSFGWHINLDEGVPLTRSQLLLDRGFFIEKNGRIELNGRAYVRSFLNKEMRIAIKKELRAQWEKIRDNGISITHVDSHHFYHTQPCMVQILPSLFNEFGIKRCRNIGNYATKGLSGFARSSWSLYYKLLGMKMPDTFCSFLGYYNNPQQKQRNTIELMCHPGHQDPVYVKEFELLKDVNFADWDAKLITYRDI